MGRATHGVKGIDVGEGDEVVGLVVSDRAGRACTCSPCASKGYGKRTHIDEFRTQNRGGKGIILIDASERNGPVVGIKLVKDGDEVMLITDRGQTLRTRVDEIRETGRNAQGVKLMTLGEGERSSPSSAWPRAPWTTRAGPRAMRRARTSVPPTSMPPSEAPPEGDVN